MILKKIKIVCVITCLFFTLNIVHATSIVEFDTSGSCDIGGTITIVEHVEEYRQDKGIYVKNIPGQYQLTIDLDFIKCLSVEDDGISVFEDQFTIDTPNVISVYDRNIKNGDVFEIGDNIRGIVRFESNQNIFDSYNIKKSVEKNITIVQTNKEDEYFSIKALLALILGGILAIVLFFIKSKK